jgi:NDP-sugar pyrophosphorylase family protein
MINIVIPMAGLGSRFSAAGFEKPKPFIDVSGKAMIVRVLENLAYQNARYILIARKEHIQKESELVNEIKKSYNVDIITIDEVTEGTACTVLAAKDFINNDDPLVIANSDQIVDINFHDFVDDSLNRNLDGSILTFIDEKKNPKWSFAKINKNQMVTKVKEKQPISKYATVGIYMFNKGRYFIDGVADMITSNDRVNGEFYTCPVYNYLISDRLQIGIYDIDPTLMHGIGTPEDLDKYLKVISTERRA